MQTTKTQEELDRMNLRAIEDRAQQRAVAAPEPNTARDQAQVKADVANFEKISNPVWRESAAVQMVDNARQWPGYQQALQADVSGVRETVQALERGHQDKIMAKEDRKATEMKSMLEDMQAIATQWTPEQARQLAQRDIQAYQGETVPSERSFKRDDIALYAGANAHYRATLETQAPRLAQELLDQRSAQNTPEMSLDPSSLRQLASIRALDSRQARESMGLNILEPQTSPSPAPVKTGTTNSVESDEVFTATQSGVRKDVQTHIPPAIEKQYLRVGNQFFDPRNTDSAAFEDKGNKLETRSNSHNVAETLVQIARARGWDEIKVSGSETFRKEVWLEANQLGMRVKGYTPQDQDKAELARRVHAQPANRIEQKSSPAAAVNATATPDVARIDHTDRTATFLWETPEATVKAHPELAGTVAAAIALDQQVKGSGMTSAQQTVVAARVRQNIVNSIERGDTPSLKIAVPVEEVRSQRTEREYAR
jgi:Large polyvalent protein-associated domain 7